MRRLAVAVVIVLGAMFLTVSAGAKVLRVGTYHGIKGQYATIQAAVRAAKPGDWVLVAPGDYKTTTSSIPSNSGGDFPAGVLITQAHLHLRGMNRNTVIVDGTKSGPPCNHIKADQNFGPNASGGPAGLNGVMVWKADDVSVENLTACNFLGGSGGDGGTGNEIWWNGGAGSGGATTVSIGGWGYYGAYLNATSTWYDNTVSAQQAEVSAAEYGIFSSNWSGGTWDHSYASNMNDSGYYIGACSQQCDQTLNHGWSEYNALGYSGSNSGWTLIENSQFDNNEDGFSSNSQNGDNPPPQDGACPAGVKPPVPGAHTCWVFIHNYVHDNNDPNVPTAGTAAAGPVGTGMSLAGSRDDTVMDNRFANNKAWGVIFVPYPDSGPPCTGGTGGSAPNAPCDFEEWGDALIGNTFSNNGGYGNPTNGDFGWTSFQADPTNCYAGNKDTDGTFTSAPSGVEQTYPVCNGQTVAPGDSNPQSAQFASEVLCDSQISLTAGAQPPCSPTDHYPRATQIDNGLHPLPPAEDLPTMPNPCAGVPANPWCPAHKTRRRHKARRGHKVAHVKHRVRIFEADT